MFLVNHKVLIALFKRYNHLKELLILVLKTMIRPILFIRIIIGRQKVNSITNRQMVMLLIVTMSGYSIIVLPKVMAQSAGTGSWLVLIIAALFFSFAAMVIVSINNLFRGHMLFDYAPSLIGKPLTYIIVSFYIVYFMMILVYLITMKARLLNAEFFPNTPLWAFPVVGIPVFCYIANKGITNAARLAELIGIVYIITALFIHILMITQGKVNRILPLFNSAEFGNYAKGLKEAIFPFLGIELLLAAPLAKTNGKKAKRTAFFAVLSIGALYILIVESCIMKVGLNNIMKYNDPLIVAIRDTALEYMDIFTRIDILFLTVGVAGIFVGISIIMAVIIDYLCKIFKNMKRQIIVIIIGVASYIQFYFFKDIEHYDDFVTAVGTFSGLVASILIPSVLWAVAKKKRKMVKGKKDAV